MKDFRICNHDLDNWVEVTFHNAVDVVRFIEKRKFPTYEIEWETPVTGEYATLLFVENNVVTYESDVFKIPFAFKKLGK